MRTCKSSRCEVQEHSCSSTACRGCSIFTKAATKFGRLIVSFGPASCCPKRKSGLEAQAVFILTRFCTIYFVSTSTRTDYCLVRKFNLRKFNCWRKFCFANKNKTLYGTTWHEVTRYPRIFCMGSNIKCQNVTFNTCDNFSIYSTSQQSIQFQYR